jgi:hypothetical protein
MFSPIWHAAWSAESEIANNMRLHSIIEHVSAATSVAAISEARRKQLPIYGEHQ